MIEWREDEQSELYRRLLRLKKKHPALWNGAWGGRMVRIPNDAESAVLTLVRAKDGDAVLGALNFSAVHQTVTLGAGPHHGTWTDPFGEGTATFGEQATLTLPAWGYCILVG